MDQLLAIRPAARKRFVEFVYIGNLFSPIYKINGPSVEAAERLTGCYQLPDVFADFLAARPNFNSFRRPPVGRIQRTEKSAVRCQAQ
jgi:hypothetical protein